MTQLVSAVTNLSMETAEEWQVCLFKFVIKNYLFNFLISLDCKLRYWWTI
jgi:hypothetical protein